MSENHQAPNKLHKANGIKIVISNDPLSNTTPDSLGAPYSNGFKESDELLPDEKLTHKDRLSIDGYDRVSFCRSDGSGSECSDRLSVSGIQLKDKKKSVSKMSLSVPDSEPESEPDGGWGWVVVFSCFFQNLLVDGTLCMFGTMYVYLMDEFKSTSLQTSAILSVQLSLQALLSPLASALIINYGARVVMMLGATLMATGTLISGFVPNIYFLYMTMGVITGVGMSMLSQTASVVVSFYFSKRRGIANGISTTGSGLGFFIFPPLATYLLDELGLQGTCLMFSGIMLQGVVFGALVIPLKEHKKMRQKSKLSKHGIASLVKATHAQFPMVLTPMDNSGMYMASVHYYNKYSSIMGAESRCERFCTLLREITKASFDVKLLKNGAYMLYLLGTVMRQLVGYIPSMFIVDRALSFGIHKESTGFLMSVFGVTNIVGRLVFGFLADVKYIKEKRAYLYACVAIAAGVVTLFNFGPLLSHQMIYCGIYGLMYGCTVTLKCTVLVDIIGNKKICTGFGMTMFAAGFTVFLGPSSAGWIFDATGSYDVVFGVCGSFFIASGIVVLPMMWVSRRFAKKVEDTQQQKNLNGHSALSVNNTRGSMMGSRLSMNRPGSSSSSLNKLSDR